MSWLAAVPHQIPFRAASSFRKIDDRTVEGDFLASSADALAGGMIATQLLVVEAMAQIGGGLAFGDHGDPAFLSAIEDARFESPIEEGDALKLRVTLDAGFGRIFRFSGTAARGEVEVVRARFYLAAQES